MRIVRWLACAINGLAGIVTVGLLLSTPSFVNSGAEWLVVLFVCPYAVLIALACLCSRRKIEGGIILAFSLLVSAIGLSILMFDADTPSTPYFSGFVSIFALMAQGALVLLLCVGCLIALLIRRFFRIATAESAA